MKKKILLALTMIAILTVLFAISVSASTPVETWDVSATEDDSVAAYLYADPMSSGKYTLTITGAGKMKGFTSSMYAPWYSSYRASITSVTIEEGVTSIGSSVFYDCIGLTSIEIPSSVKSIGYSAFENCTSLKSIYIPESVTYIEYSTFRGCSNLTGIEIPKGVTGIGNYAFDGCYSLKNIEIPNSVTLIGQYAFRNCTGLTSMVIPDSVISIWEGAFSGCSSLETITLPFVGGSIEAESARASTLFGFVFGKDSYSGGVSTKQYYTPSNFPSDGYNVTYYIPSSLKSVIITGGQLFYGAFYGCYNLTNIEIPGSITSIGPYAFYNCKNLTSIDIPEGVTSIGYYAFYNCKNLTSIDIPEGVTSIDGGMFSDCSNLEGIEIPKRVTYIGDYAFNGCTSFTNIEIPDSVTTIGTCAFDGCYSLKNIEIPNSVTLIGQYAFRNCTGLTSMVIPDSVISIWEGAFSGCSSLETITLPFVGGSIEAERASASTLFGFVFGKDSYSGGVSTKQYYTPSNFPSDGYNVTYYIPSSLKSVIITGGQLFYGAFYGCYNLTNIEIPGSITSIGPYVFYNCKNLTSINIPEGVTSIGYYAFYNCKNLTSIDIPDGVTSIGDGMFSGCSNLEGIEIPKRVTYIGNDAFNGCTSFTNIEIPDSVTSIYNYAFYNCKALTSVVIPNSVTSIGDYAFSGCTSLTSVVIPDSVTSIYNYAFQNCSILKIYCEAKSKPSNWKSYWNYSSRPVVWDYKSTLQNDIFIFKGYSFNETGSMAVGYDIDYETKAFYEELTGATLDIGVVFAAFDLLGGQNPLDNEGMPITLDVGRVAQRCLNEFNYTYYDFVINGISTDELKNYSLVISAYIFDGEAVRYIQANGINDTVCGITYNEAKGGQL